MTYLDVAPEEKTQPKSVSGQTPFRIALLGDFSARSNRVDLRQRRPVRVDLDNADDVLARMDARLELPGPDAPIRIRFESFDDFHPDSLHQKVELFRQLERMRQAPDLPKPAREASPPRAIPDPGGLLDAIIGGAEAPTRAKRPPDPWQQTIRDIVAPYLEPRPDPQRAALAARIDETITLAMRLVLHHPDFQAVEAAWRAVDFLLRRLETGANLQICLIDVGKQELLDDLSAANPRRTALYRLLVEQGSAVGEVPWALIGGLYTFGPHPDDFRALSALAWIAHEAGAPFLSSASPRLLGCECFGGQPDPDDWTAKLDAEAEQEWEFVRHTPEARWVGLALPRFLLRAPYARDSVDLRQFEEMIAPPDHADFLWANPAVACIQQIGEAFLCNGWNLTLRAGEIAGLPLHTYKMDGETLMTPCAECWMPERTAERFLARGIMPLASIKGRDAARLVRFQSIAVPDSRLLARWSPE
jgi:type VI secretion system protein ImpC